MKSSILERLTSKRVRLNRLRNRVIEYLEGIPADAISRDQKEVLEYLRENDISVFPYEFPQKYDASDIELSRDPKNGLYYMLWEGKRLYYKNGSRASKAAQYINSLHMEQGFPPPYRYRVDDFVVAEA